MASAAAAAAGTTTTTPGGYDNFPPLDELVIPTEWQNAHDELMKELMTTTTCTTKTAREATTCRDGSTSRRSSLASFINDTTGRLALSCDSDDDDDDAIMHDGSRFNARSNTADIQGRTATYLPDRHRDAGSPGHVQQGHNLYQYPTKHPTVKKDSRTIATSAPASRKKKTTTKQKGRYDPRSAKTATATAGLKVKNNNKINTKLCSKARSGSGSGSGSVQSPSGPMEELDSVAYNYNLGMNNSSSSINNNKNVVPDVVQTWMASPPGLDVIMCTYDDDVDDDVDDDYDDYHYNFHKYDNNNNNHYYFLDDDGGAGGASSSIVTSSDHNTLTLDGMLAIVEDAMDYAVDDDDDGDDDDDVDHDGVNDMMVTDDHDHIGDAVSSSFVSSSKSTSTQSHKVIAGLPYEQRYKATFEKLQESLKRSQETRKWLSIQTVQTLQYDRLASLNGVLSSIKVSSSQLQMVVAKTTATISANGNGSNNGVACCPSSPILQRQVL